MRSYGQYCGLAKALDHIGDRWTLLIVRELLIGNCRYSDLRAALPGIATNLLADRLREMEADGIVGRSGDGRYELTPFGRELEPVVHGLVRWATPWMRQRSRGEAFRPEWLVVALEALLPKRRSGRVEVHCEGTVVALDRGSISPGPLDAPDAVVEGRAEEVLGAAVGELPLSALSIRGSRAAAAAAFGRPQA